LPLPSHLHLIFIAIPISGLLNAGRSFQHVHIMDSALTVQKEGAYFAFNIFETVTVLKTENHILQTKAGILQTQVGSLLTQDANRHTQVSSILTQDAN
jgi:hypothetical protein